MNELGVFEERTCGGVTEGKDGGVVVGGDGG